MKQEYNPQWMSSIVTSSGLAQLKQQLFLLSTLYLKHT